jgi:hypothetical protein
VREFSVDLSVLARGEGIRAFQALIGLVRERIHQLGPQLVGPELKELGFLEQVAAELKNCSQLVVVGEPGAIRAAHVLNSSSSKICWVDHPLRVPVLEGAGVVLLEGPGWADRVAEEANAKDCPVFIAGTGEPDPPPGGWWVQDSDAGGPFSVGALVAAAWGGKELPTIEQQAASAQEQCLKLGLYENPAAGLAVSWLPVQGGKVMRGPVLLAADPGLLPLVEWISDELSEKLQWRGIQEQSLDVRAGLLGDERRMGELFEAPGYRVISCWEGRQSESVAGLVAASRELVKSASCGWVGARVASGAEAGAAVIARAGVKLAASLLATPSSWARGDWRKRLRG